MKMIKPLATKMVATFSLVALLAAPTTAQALDASDMAFAFGGKGQVAQMAQPEMIASARGMTQTEMQETEGAWLWHAVYHGGGALMGGYGAGYGYLAGGGTSGLQFTRVVLGGAAAGAWSPVRGFGTAGLTFGGGFTGGFGVSRGWW